MNHAGEGLSHEAKHRCRYTVQYDNRVYTCKVRAGGGVCLSPADLCSRGHVFMFYLTSGLLRGRKGGHSGPEDLGFLRLPMDGPR